MTRSEIVACDRDPSHRRAVALIAIDGRALAAHGFHPTDLTHATVGTVLIAADGTALVVTVEGALDPWPPHGRRSIASDPAAGGFGPLAARSRT